MLFSELGSTCFNVSKLLKKSWLGFWTRQENICTIARLSFDVGLVVVAPLPVYRRIAAEATQMCVAGASVKAISRHFGVDHHTVEKAVRWFRHC